MGCQHFAMKKIEHILKEFKKKCVKSVINREGCVSDIVAQYGISSRSVLRECIMLNLRHLEKKRLYLSAIIDLYDSYPVAYVVSQRNDNRLVFKTFDKAMADNPEAKPILHSDRGFQYTTKYLKRSLKSKNLSNLSHGLAIVSTMVQ